MADMKTIESLLVDRKKVKRKEVQKIIEAVKARKDASDSAVMVPINVDGNTAHIDVFGDLHVPDCDMNKLEQDLEEASLIKNNNIVFLGDFENSETRLRPKTSSAENAPTSIRENKDILADIVERTGVKDLIRAILEGNHEQAHAHATSVRLGEELAKDLGVPLIYYGENLIQLVVFLDNPVDEDKKIPVVLTLRHGEKISANEGGAMDEMEKSKVVQLVDINVVGHTHKIYMGTGKKHVHKPGRKTPDEKIVHSVNFGSRQEGAKYADKTGWSPTPKVEGEILTIQAVQNEQTGEVEVVVNFDNKKEIVTKSVKEAVASMEKDLEDLNSKDYKTIDAFDKAYAKKAQTILGKHIKEYNKEKSQKKLTNGNGVDEKIYLAPLSGFEIGNPDVKNDDEIDSVVKTLSKLDKSCKVILNGDMVKYKKANLLKQKNYPEETFSYMQMLAEKIEPIKDKIVAFNLGENEEKIVTYHGGKLAKFAKSRLQMEDSLVYKSYNKRELDSERKKAQSRKVEEYNKSRLEREEEKLIKKYTEYIRNVADKFEKDEEIDETQIDQNMETLRRTVASKIKEYEVNPSAIDEEKMKENDDVRTYSIKEAVEDAALKNLDGKLLSLRKDKTLIEKKFPLEKMIKRKPHPNIIQNMVCEMLNVPTENIAMNSTSNIDDKLTFRLKGEDNKKIINFDVYGGYNKSIAKRAAIKNKLDEKSDFAPGCDVYYVNGRAGREGFVKDSANIINEKGETVEKSMYKIMGGRFDSDSNIHRDKRQSSNNRLYVFKGFRSEVTPDMIEDKVDMRKREEIDRVYGMSKDYRTLEFEKDYFEDVLETSYKKTYNKKRKELKEKLEKNKNTDILNYYQEKKKLSANKSKKKEGPKSNSEEKSLS